MVSEVVLSPAASFRPWKVRTCRLMYWTGALRKRLRMTPVTEQLPKSFGPARWKRTLDTVNGDAPATKRGGGRYTSSRAWGNGRGRSTAVSINAFRECGRIVTDRGSNVLISLAPS